MSGNRTIAAVAKTYRDRLNPHRVADDQGIFLSVPFSSSKSSFAKTWAGCPQRPRTSLSHATSEGQLSSGWPFAPVVYRRDLKHVRVWRSDRLLEVPDKHSA
jgi:hypothetical protein